MTTTANDDVGSADFLGIEAVVEGIKYKGGRNATRAVVTLSFPSGGKRDLLAQLAESMEGPVFIGWGFPQMTLDFQDANAQVFAQKPVRQMITPDGEIILPHMFRPGRPDRSKCAICETPETNGIHSEESRKAVHDAQPDDQAAP